MRIGSRTGLSAQRPTFSKRAVVFTTIGVVAAATALIARQAARRAEQANPAKGKFIEVDGVRLHYTERGQGQAVVLLHGFGMMIEDFETSGVLDLAAKTYRVITFDRPGYGHSTRPRGRRWDPASQAELLYQALQHLGIEAPIVIGHSWGTLVAISLALKHPEYARGLVLLSGYYYPTVRLDVLLLSPPALPVLGDVLRYTISPLISRITWPLLVRLLFGPARVPERFAQFPVSMAMRPSQLRATAAEAALAIPCAAALRSRYRDLRVPTVILAGESDRFVRTKHHSVRLHKELPQSELMITAGAGHMAHHAAPEHVIRAIESVERLALLQTPARASASMRKHGNVPEHSENPAKSWTGH